ncbi:MAG: N-acetylglucosamine-6-phosphate deacetylase [Acidobacteriia bacterium]|nr:N-acetylglucosamine-6-phosphate deacetylase [Terriglobia bacterium]
MKTILTASLLLTPLEQIFQPLLVMEDGRIVQVGSRAQAEVPAGARVLDFPDAVLAPGFIDIHVHGGAGHDVMHASAAELESFERYLATSGVTSYFPTTITAPLDATFVALERLASAIETVPQRERIGDVRAQPLGIHLEGPFISHAKRGVHPAEHLQAPDLQVFDRLWQAARGQVSFMTVAPELPKSEYLIGEAARRGVCVSLGHSDSTLAQVETAIAAGARHATHTFNAMRALDHREPGILGAALAEQRLTADVIADGIHVHPEIVSLFLRAKGPERAVLITDAISASGMGDGRYRLGGLEVEVHGQRCECEGRLAGSVLTLDRSVRNVMEFAGWDLRHAVRLATLNPARIAGVAGRKGVIAPGADADIVVLTSRGEVIQTFVGGA